LCFIRPGRPVENGFIESFNGRLRDECLNVEWFGFDGRCAAEAGEVPEALQRAASAHALADRTPAAFAALHLGKASHLGRAKPTSNQADRTVEGQNV